MTALSISSSERKRLKGLAHHLDPVVQIGRSELTDSVVAEAERAIASHELMKVRIDIDDRHQRSGIADELASRLEAAHVDSIGRIAILWRRKGDEE